ncbi:MAG: carbon-nitrogen hydrolase [Planctomycetaceae bacterium]|nr:carbon-nitrogen hydrolase [Planctomycetaceae bacterium]
MTKPTTQPAKVTIGLVQMTCTKAKQPNVDKAVARIGEAAAAGAQIVCLQELFAGHYPCQEEDFTLFDDAEPIPGPTTERIAAAAKQHQVVVVGSFFERRAPGLYHNTALVFDADGTTLGMYRKMHIPDDPHYYEKFYFTPGDLGFGAVNTRYGRLGVLVCWDQWYPEAARITALHGAQIIFYPTAIGWQAHEKAQFGASQHSAWETSMRAHAIANGLFIVAINRIGTEDHIEFWGGSFVADPTGTLLAKGSHEHEETMLVECDLDQIDFVRTHWPFLRDRRIDAYGDITKRWIGDA